MKGFTRFCFFIGLCVVLAGLAPVYAQVDYSTATLRGTVTDPQGAVIPGATVTVTNPSTGITKTAKTLADGSYQVPALPPGTYNVTVEGTGFAKEVAKGIQVSVGQVFIYDAHMKIGSASEIIEVSTDNVPLIQTEQSQQANTINAAQVEELPNIAHNITQQVYTLPGVANADSPRAQNPGFTGFGTTGFSIGGSNGRNNLSTIDGGENEYGSGQYRVTTIPQDTIQEYQVNRNAFAAEFGFTDGSAINLVTKSGGNQFHGTGYGYFQDHNTSAQNFFNGLSGLPAAYNQNIYTGFTVGGPIKQDKLFFFLAYEYRDLVNPDFSDVNVLNAPTVQGPSAAQTTYVNALKTSGNPFLVGFGNGITPGLTPLNNPALKKILTAENHVFLNPFHYHNTIARFDANPNSTNFLNLRLEYLHNDSNAGNPDASGLFTRDFSILSTWNHTFSPSVLNQVLVQVVPRNVANNVPNPFQGVNFSLGNLNTGNLGGTSTFGSPSLVPYLAHQKRYQFEDNLSWNVGSHSFKLGASVRLADYTVTDKLWFNNEFDFKDGVIPLFSLAPSKPVGPCPPLPPSVQLSAVQCQLALFNLGHGFPVTGPTNTNLSGPQSFAFGIPADVLGGFNNPTWTGWGKYIGTYVQDTWKLTSRLTLNGGVRFDTDSEAFPIGSNFYASPRLGFAWDPWGDHKTVIRGGAGVYVAPIDVLIPSYGNLLDGTGRYINEVIGILSATDTRVAQLWQTGVALGILPFGSLTPQQFQQFSTTPTLPGFNPNAPGATVGYSISNSYKDPYTVQGSFSIDHQFGRSYSLEIGYDMYHGVHLQMPLETGLTQINPGNPLCHASPLFPINPAACTDGSGGPLYTFNSTQLQHTTYESIGSSKYNAATVSLTKRFSQGLQFQANYTWSKAIDNVIDFASFQNWFRPSQLSNYYTTSVFDIPQTLVVNAVYTTPFKTGGNVLKTIFADITLAPIELWHSGLPFSVRTPSLANVVNPLTGTLTAGLDQNYASPFGVSRDTQRGAAYSSTDLTFNKRIFINRERGISMNFVAIGTNIFNRINFNKVSDQFDIGGLPLPSAACPVNTCAGIVQTAMGPVNVFSPSSLIGLHAVKPTSSSQATLPLSYSSADLPRQLQFGLKLIF